MDPAQVLQEHQYRLAPQGYRRCHRPSLLHREYHRCRGRMGECHSIRRIARASRKFRRCHRQDRSNHRCRRCRDRSLLILPRGQHTLERVLQWRLGP